jgi:DNA-binding MarR family transcriptional regulator
VRQEGLEDVGRRTDEGLFDGPNTSWGVGPEAWETELNRLRPKWEETRRQDLTMGAAAYGLALGVPPEKVREDLLNLAKASDDPEIEKRRDAVNRTLSKHAEGKRVAWRTYYQRAGLEPPRGKYPSPEVLFELEFLKAKVLEKVWKGKGGLTNRDAYLSLIEVSQAHGTPHERGVEISISTRDLASRAGVSRETVIKALQRLERVGLVERASRGRGAESGSLLLLVNGDELQAYRDAGEGDQQVPDPTSSPRLRYGSHKLGKLAGAILGVLETSGPMTRPEIARALNRKSRDIKAPIHRLESRELVEFDEESRCYSLPADHPQVLVRELERDGTYAVEARDRKRFREEREAFYKTVLADREGANVGRGGES